MKPMQFVMERVRADIGSVPDNETETAASLPQELSELFAVAFDGGDARVRGVAWCIIGRAVLAGGSKPLHEQVRRTLAERFGIPTNHQCMETLPEMWLQAIAMELEARIQDQDQVYKQFRAQLLRAKCGDDLDAIKDSPAEFLSHPLPERREAALEVLWEKPDKSLATKIKEMVTSDPADVVRIAAIMALRPIFKRSEDRAIVRFLADIAVDASESCEVREVAYMSLYRIKVVDSDQWPDVRMLPGEFVFPDHANWQFVESCLQIT
jgi:hypothetical protein